MPQSWDINVSGCTSAEEVSSPKQAVGVEISDQQLLVQSRTIGRNRVGWGNTHPVVLALDDSIGRKRSPNEEHKQANAKGDAAGSHKKKG